MIYLDYASMGRLRPRAVETMRTALDSAAIGSAGVPELYAYRAPTRELAARLLGASVDEVAFVPNTSTGIQLVADGLDWRPGDEIVLFDQDFPANVRPWLALARHGVVVRWVPMREGGYRPEDLAAVVGPATRLIATTYVHFATGFRVDLDAVCAIAATVGALVFVDAMQGLGAVPLSVASTPVDFVAAGCHKWLCGPTGTGLLYCRASRLPLLAHLPAGWYGYQGAEDLSVVRYDLPPRPALDRVEGGMYGMVDLVGLHAALDELLVTGLDPVGAGIRRSTRRLRDGLAELGYPLACQDGDGSWSGIVSFTGAARCADRLAAADVRVSTMGELVRVAPHYWTSDEEIDVFLDALR